MNVIQPPPSTSFKQCSVNPDYNFENLLGSKPHMYNIGFGLSTSPLCIMVSSFVFQLDILLNLV